MKVNSVYKKKYFPSLPPSTPSRAKLKLGNKEFIKEKVGNPLTTNKQIFEALRKSL